MTLRERIADWISGGKLTQVRGYYDKALDRLDVVTSKYIDEGQRRIDEMSVKNSMRRALSEISAMETPGANGTVKRMAKRARDALE